MSSRHDDHMDDAEFEAFLEGKGELADLLRQLPQPAPSPILSEKILADAEAALAKTTSANDTVMPDAAGQPLPPHFLRRAGKPLALVASVALAVAAGLQWYGHASQDSALPAGAVLVAKAPSIEVQPHAQPAEPPRAELQRAEPPSVEARQAPSTPHVPVAPKTAAPKTAASGTQSTGAVVQDKASIEHERQEQQQDAARMLAQADSERHDTMLKTRDAPLETRLSTPAANMIAAAPPPPSLPLPTHAVEAPTRSIDVTAEHAGRMKAVVGEKAQAWLERIDELIKQDKRDEALRSWDDFRKQYPNYPVPEKLSGRINALKK